MSDCESTVWFHYQYDEERMTLSFSVDSDARIIRGLIALVLVSFNDKTPAQIQTENIETWLEELGLLNHLSPSRGNGLKAIINEVRSVANRYL